MKAWILSLVLFAVNCSAATYYIDYASGADTNAGTAKTAPWKRHPYQSTFTGRYTHAAGDRFIFKGGVTWPAAAGRIVMAGGGSSTAGNDYYGVDQTWYSGTSWTRPVFDAEYTNGGCIAIQNNSYVTVDNLEAKRALCPSDNWACISIDTGSHILISNCYVHGWRTTSSSDGNHGGVIVAQFTSGNNTIVLDHTEVENSENIGVQMNGNCLSRVGTIRNGSKIHDNSSGILFCLDFGGPDGMGYAPSELYNITGNGFDLVYHYNGIYLDPTTMGFTQGYIRNSYLHDVSGGANMAYPNVRGGATVTMYNNVLYGKMSAQLAVEIDPFNYGAEGPGNFIAYNNTICNYSSTSTAFHVVTRSTRLGTLSLFNNHVINAPSVTDAIVGVNVGTYTNGTNLVQSAATATLQGYVLGNLYAPTVGDSTIDAGTSKSQTLTTDIKNNVRSGAWDIGAYEFGGSSGIIAPSSATILITAL